MKFSVLGMIALALFPVTALSDTSSKVVGEVIKCAQIAQSDARLQCYDASVLAMKSQIEKNHVSGVAEFGLPPKRSGEPADFGLPGPVPTTNSASASSGLYAVVSQWATMRDGGLIFILENGQVWQQVGGDQGKFRNLEDIEVIKVRIEAAIFGTYDLKIEGRKGILKVRRSR